MRSAATASAMRPSWGSSTGGAPGGPEPGLPSAAGSAVGHHDGTPPVGAWVPPGAARKSACGPGMVRAVACKAATEWPIMASVVSAGRGFSAAVVVLSSSASFLIRSWMSSTLISGCATPEGRGPAA